MIAIVFAMVFVVTEVVTDMVTTSTSFFKAKKIPGEQHRRYGLTSMLLPGGKKCLRSRASTLQPFLINHEE